MIRSKTRMRILWAIVAMALRLWLGAVKPAHVQGAREDDIVLTVNGSTSVAGNLASGTVKLSNQETAPTNQPNTLKASQNIDADFHTKGPNPWLDITRFGGYIGPNYSTNATTCSIRAGSASANCAAASDFQNGHGILILGAGPKPAIATPRAPTVTQQEPGIGTRSCAPCRERGHHDCDIPSRNMAGKTHAFAANVKIP